MAMLARMALVCWGYDLKLEGMRSVRSLKVVDV